MRELKPQEFALAIAIVVSHRRTCISRRQRTRTAYIDDCLSILDLQDLNPKIRKFTTSGIVRARDVKKVRLCEETRAIYEAIAPVVRELTAELEERDVIAPTPRPADDRARSAETLSAGPATPSAGER